MKIVRDGFTTTVESALVSSGVDMKATFSKTGGDNSDAPFCLTIGQGGQVWAGGTIDMCGPHERTDLLDFLEAVVSEIKLLDGRK